MINELYMDIQTNTSMCFFLNQSSIETEKPYDNVIYLAVFRFIGVYFRVKVFVLSDVHSTSNNAWPYAWIK